MEFVYTPKACKDDGEKKATFEGTVTLKDISYDEQCDAQEALNLAMADVPAAIAGVRSTREAVKIVAPYVLKVEIKRLADGREFKSWDELKAGKCHAVLNDVATHCLVGSGNG